MVYNRSARGNTSLESALTLTKAIRHDIQSLGVTVSDLSDQVGGRKRHKNSDEIRAVMREIKTLLRKIEDVCRSMNWILIHKVNIHRLSLSSTWRSQPLASSCLQTSHITFRPLVFSKHRLCSLLVTQPMLSTPLIPLRLAQLLLSAFICSLLGTRIDRNKFPRKI